MGRSEPGLVLAAFLTELKERGGLSYEQLGRKAHLSRSTVHRYCVGRSVPATFAPIEAIATACQASRADLAKLYRLWERADLVRPPKAGGADPVDVVPTQPDEPVPAPPRARTRSRIVLAAVLAVLLLAAGSLAAPRDGQPAAASTAIDPPMWSSAPRVIGPEFVGVTINSNTGLMPTFPVGSVRFWNSKTRWHNLEPARGLYRWEGLDRLVAGATGVGRPMVFTLGGTPEWASPAGVPTVFGDGSRADPPDDLADWQRFVRALAERYRGVIGAYELWDEGNIPAFFNGSMAELVEMTRLASQAIRGADPAAIVMCPSMGELWDPVAMGRLTEFAELGGYRYCDGAAVKLGQRFATDPPETMVPLSRELEKVLHRTRTGIPLWSTGGALDVGNEQPLGADRGANYAVRFFLAGLYAHYYRMYFYNWGNATIPIVLQPAGGPETKAARYVARLHEWLTDSRISSCGQGRTAGLPDGLWQCRFELRGKTFLIWWTLDATLRLPVAASTTSVERLDGTGAPVEPGATVTVTGSPILLRVG